MTIGVFPPQARLERTRLLNALEQVFPVRFEPRVPGENRGLDAIVRFDTKKLDHESAGARGIPVFIVQVANSAPRRIGRVQFSDVDGLDRRLRGRSLEDEREVPFVPLDVRAGEVLFAASGDRALWARELVRGSHIDRVSIGPMELAEGKSLRDEIWRGRFFALVPFIHFIREVVAAIDWRPPPLRASVIVDDPNLHRPSYGCIGFEELSSHAGRHGYHAAMALIPLDAWGASREAVRIFREHPDRLSLLVHGNNHTRHELASWKSERETQAQLAQALHRCASFERKYCLPIDRVMVPPHERFSKACWSPLLQLGFEAVSLTRPYGEEADAPLTDPTALWEPVEWIGGGLPVIRRISLTRWRSDRAFRDDVILSAFLNKPLVFSAHHGDFAEGLGVLEELATELARLGDVQWMSLASIARSDYLTRSCDSILHVKLLSRRARVPIPLDIDGVRIFQGNCNSGGPADDRVMGSSAGREREAKKGVIAWQAEDRPEELEVRLLHRQGLDPDLVTKPALSIRAIARRFLTEGRDRLRLKA